MPDSSCILRPDELSELGPDLRWIDARGGEAGRRGYAEGHVEGAVYADLERHLAAPTDDPSTGGRHPLPDIETWAAQLGDWGITPTTPVVVYDDSGGANAAARCWWMLRAAGHRPAWVLDGGLEAARRAGLELVTTQPGIEPQPPYPVDAWQSPVADLEEVDRRRTASGSLLIDVRDEPRFRGETEPFDPVAGRIPGARNLPFRLSLAADGRMKEPEELRRLFDEALGSTPTERVIVSCGSGVTACHTLLTLEHLGRPGAALYVGSWSEWCRSGKEMAKGPSD